MQFDTIIFHSPCSDGTTGAWAIWNYNRHAKLIPIGHGMKIDPVDYIGKKLAIVDFCFPRNYLLQIVEKSQHVVLLDHHESAKRDLKGIDHPKLQIIFDMKRSGAQIAWDYMNPSYSRPWFVECIADRDLWKWEFTWSKAVGRSTLEMGYHSSVQKVDELINSGKDYSSFIELGNILLEKDDKNIQKFVDNVELCDMKTELGTYRVAVSSGYYSRSEVGDKILKKYQVDFAVMYTYDFPKDEWWLSFRCSKNSNIDLSLISSTLPNGGGHAKSAGATIYGANSNPPAEFKNRKGETMYTYFSRIF